VVKCYNVRVKDLNLSHCTEAKGVPPFGGTCLSGPFFGGTRLSRPLRLDDPVRFGGHDKHAPPISLSEGPACRVRKTYYLALTTNQQTHGSLSGKACLPGPLDNGGSPIPTSDGTGNIGEMLILVRGEKG